MSVRAMRQALAVFALNVIALIVAAFLLYRYALRYPDRPALRAGQAISVSIPPGANFPRVVAILAERKLIRSPLAFRVYVNYRGQAAKIRAGTYAFPSDVTPRRLLDVLVHGVSAPQVTVVIPEGKNMLEVAEILAQAGVAPREALAKEMRDRRFLARLGVQAGSIEGYLFPDTYKLKASTPAQEVLTRLHARHNSVYAPLAAKYGASLKWFRKRLAWGWPEIVTLASIVEKETGQEAERPRIAGVFLNRLTFSGFSPKLLQTDPTIIYGCTVPLEKSPACRKFEGRIRRMHLDDAENPYNTYTHTGLPPGPISNPGRASLEAVLAPEKSKYLYFVSKNDKTHFFSATKTEHEAAVARYQK
jgi:UPF0755 protein